MRKDLFSLLRAFVTSAITGATTAATTGAFAISFVAIVFGTTNLYASDALHVMNAKIQMPVKAAKVMAGYATLMNHGAQDKEVTAISSDAFQRIEMHKTEIENDVAKMRKQKSLLVMKNESLLLERGGLHLMLIQPVEELNTGDEVVVSFEFKDGSTQAVSFIVDEPVSNTGDDHSGHGNAHQHKQE